MFRFQMSLNWGYLEGGVLNSTSNRRKNMKNTLNPQIAFTVVKLTYYSKF